MVSGAKPSTIACQPLANPSFSVKTKAVEMHRIPLSITSNRQSNRRKPFGKCYLVPFPNAAVNLRSIATSFCSHGMLLSVCKIDRPNSKLSEPCKNPNTAPNLKSLGWRFIRLTGQCKVVIESKKSNRAFAKLPMEVHRLPLCKLAQPRVLQLPHDKPF